jgi:hypothetical protein
LTLTEFEQKLFHTLAEMRRHRVEIISIKSDLILSSETDDENDILRRSKILIARIDYVENENEDEDGKENQNDNNDNDGDDEIYEVILQQRHHLQQRFYLQPQEEQRIKSAERTIRRGRGRR